jgi:hypothetical protein
MAAVESLTSNVSVAVRLRDDFSKEWFLVDKTRVFVKESGREALENPSKYRVFLDLAGASFTVRVENKYYFEQEVGVAIAGLNPRHPLVSVTMIPRCRYPFPRGATLIRGRIVDSAAAPVAGATIMVTGTAMSNRSEPEGQFVLYFGPAREEDVVLQNNERLMKVLGSTSIDLTVMHPDYHSRIVTVGTVVEGATRLLAASIPLTHV